MKRLTSIIPSISGDRVVVQLGYDDDSWDAVAVSPSTSQVYNAMLYISKRLIIDDE